MIMKFTKIISLMLLMLSISSAVANWGGEITKNPVAVFTGIMVFLLIYAVTEYSD